MTHMNEAGKRTTIWVHTGACVLLPIESSEPAQGNSLSPAPSTPKCDVAHS
jgi:hypothetical protein